MLVRHSLSLTLSNMQLVFKVLLYALIVCIIGAAVFVTIAEPIFQHIGEDVNVTETLNHFLEGILDGEGSVFESIVNSVNHFVETHPNEMVEIMLLGILLIYVMKLLFAVIVCPSAYVLNNKMATNFTGGFFHAVMMVGWKGVLTALVYTLISTPIDLIIVGGAFFLGRWLVLGIGLFGMIFAIVVAILLLTIRMSIMGQWVAVFINENLTFSLQFKRGFKSGFKYMHKVFPAMLTLNILLFGVVATTLIPTFFIIPVVMMPIALIAFTVIHLVTYYMVNERDYYIDEKVIKHSK